jgi:sulfatase maturation enzyme AslB (radical SAM superfamily)
MSLKTICVLPFNTLSVGSDGAQRLCCNAIDGGLPNTGKVSHRTTTNWFDTPELNSVRSRMLAGEKIPECSRCWSLEDIGSNSYRNINNDFRFKDRFAKILAGDTSTVLEKLELDLGNKCNLACRMCHPGSSKLLAEELLAINPNDSSARWYAGMDTWIKDSKLFDVIREQGSTLKSIYLIGGEPLVIQEQEELLDLLIELGYAKNIELEYNSNITTLGSKWYDKWNQFKSVKINASIDGVGKFYEYVRWPARWDKIYNNLKELKKWGDASNGQHFVGIHSTLSNLTMPCFEQSIDTFINELGFHLFFINVDHPNFMSPWVLPDSVRTDFAESAIKSLDKTGNTDLINNTKNTLLKIAASADPSIEFKKNFIHRMKYMDSHRKQSLLEVHPWFKEWYDL